MKINVKTLKGTDFFDLNVEETDTVGQLKVRIATEKSKEVDTIKLVHKGKQLNDDSKTMKDHDIKDNDFVILMFFVKKAEKAEEPPAAEKPAQTTATTASTSSEKPPASTASTDSTSASSSSDLLHGAELEAKIKEIEDMGFERPKILQALRAAYNNPERAIDYLLSGNIPAVREQPQNVQGGQQPLQGGVGNVPGLEQLQQLVQNPDFQRISQAIQQNPQLMQPVMQQLAQTNPDIARMLQQNPQMFLQLLLQASRGGQQQQQHPPRGAIQVTPEEKADIDEIISLGFNKNDALEAYIACDKQKELAINYLFDARENGSLLSNHIEKEELQAAQERSQNPQTQHNPNQPPQQQDEEEDEDDDDFMYQ